MRCLRLRQLAGGGVGGRVSGCGGPGRRVGSFSTPADALWTALYAHEATAFELTAPECSSRAHNRLPI